ncbi:MAG: pentapeptide repeat-containing protein [Candidatus Acidiferrum sp.]
MPDQPAKSFLGFTWGGGAKQEERLATPEELAEFGALAPDPATEAQILALFEEQLLQDLIKESPAQPVVCDIPAAENENTMEMSVEANEPAEVREDECAAETAIQETAVQETATEPEPEAIAEVHELESHELASQELAVAPAEIAAEVVAEPQELENLAEQQSGVATPTVRTESGSGDLLEFAQVLDQHRMWAESNGAEGAKGHLSGANLANLDLTGANLQGAELQKVNLRGADLSMANLRNATLVEADLREANLLGTEFSGANLMGANLYGAQGLWAGRLGGTNLFDATLPEEVAALTGRKTIEQFTQSARSFYILVMALCVGACGLIALTTDVRLLLDESATVTTRIPKFLPLQGFYLGAPLLLTAFYLRLQFLLLRLWGSMGALPAVFPDGQTPEKDGRWYLMGPIRPYLRWTREPRSAVAMVECYVAMLLVYWAVPAVLFLFWLRYLVMQDYRGTLLHLVLFTAASAAACALPRVVKRVLRPGDWTDESTQQFMRDVVRATRVPVLVGLTLLLLSLGVIRGMPGDTSLRPEVSRGDPRRWAATAFQFVGYRPYADLTDESMSVHRDAAISGNGAGGDTSGPRLNEINLRYSRGYHAAFANARMWRANLEGSSLAETDFRGANLREANLRSAKMDGVKAEKANLVSADARGAAFSGGDFRGADWSFANLSGAVLTTVHLENATMYAVNLQQANLLRADLGHTDLRDAHLEAAILSLAKLEQTDFSAAKMMGANLTGAEAKGTIFLEADLSKADLRGATFVGAVLRQVKLDGANVLGADFRGASGLEAWQVCSTQGWRGAQFDADVQAGVEQSCGAGSQPSVVQ